MGVARAPVVGSAAAPAWIWRVSKPHALSLMGGASSARGLGAAAGLGHLRLAGRDPRHHGPQALADLLDGMLAALFPQGVEPGPPGLGLGHPLLGELAAGDLVEDLLHLLASGTRDDAR